MSSNIAASILNGELRSDILEYLRTELIGPVGGSEEELVGDAPNNRYIAGVLFPQKASHAEELLPEAKKTKGGEDDEESLELESLALANESLPASMGLSFYVEGVCPSFRARVEAGYYASSDDKKKRGPWHRRPLKDESTGEDFVVEFVAPEKRVKTRKSVPLGHKEGGDNGRNLTLEVLWRPGKDCWLVTVAVVNRNIQPENTSVPHLMFFQVMLGVEVLAGTSVTVYRRAEYRDPDPEERRLTLLYRHHPIFGVGHGCAAEWEQVPQGTAPRRLWTSVIPTQIIRPQNYEIPKQDPIVLSWYFLSGMGGALIKDIVSRLRSFCDGYSDWIDGLRAKHTDIKPEDSEEVNALEDGLRTALGRMRAGVELLNREPMAMRAFQLANEAMLWQREHSREEYGGKRRALRERPFRAPAISSDPGHEWRPFQLAYLLLNLESVVDLDSDFRDSVDLIWFPTGGGKTEAYLGVSAFTMFYRRLAYPETADGTVILMRYTLRLLTAQQFQRAAGLICACERIRQREGDLGDEAFSIGFWGGRDATPNYCKVAKAKHDALVGSHNRDNPFQLGRCPWCGTATVPDDPDAKPDEYGYEASDESFRFRCPDSGCPFHEGLPIQVIDEELYRAPPTLLVGTVDKFAALPWNELSGVFFGVGGNRPPELIIQDELHLISGPLGTLVGLYESAIDLLCGKGGHRPKIIASTATIRQAELQCRALYNRPVAQFPPPGFDADESYFSSLDRDGAGRMYAGVLAPGVSPTTASLRIMAALLQAPVSLELDADELEAYFTLACYYNSLRELGQGLTLAADDIPARIKVIAGDGGKARTLTSQQVEELTSNVEGSALPAVLERLEMRHYEKGAVSMVLCTNMLSVGVDVGRLALMVVVGQPKTTAEYIQATSRVGRSKVPGLVVTQYSPTRPRDRSHYEQFTGYHDAIYRYVEPTSVTPFAPPARDRALHAVLVSLVRHRLGLSANAAARSISQVKPQVKELVEAILERVEAIDPRECEATEAHLDNLLAEWETRANTMLHYEFWNRKDLQQYQTLLRDMGTHPPGWETMRSMRNVDFNSAILVVSEDA